MFKKILIANRGEIACRVIRTAKSLGIGTLAVYSDADKDALHVREADESFYIGPSPVSQSYLNLESIIIAACEMRADAVHPGYGFLSENAEFAERLGAEKICFIGPSPSAISSMGDKIEAKKVAIAAGVNTIPGCGEAVFDLQDAKDIAGEIGYPVMIKAAAGGGGKGMRIVNSKELLEECMTSAMHEAEQAFGDERVFIEKFINEPRHIEIQVLADNFGNVIHLGERECSIQRRHQKIIEEAPSPLINEKTRKAMGIQSCALARAVNYTSVGTVEFVADQQGNFFFLEMNTRLQVEHPVTEFITGLDLVEQQIRVASGEELSFSQEEVKRSGWSIECRLYAEDPERGFMPSTGRLSRYQEPAKNENIRVDTGVYEGGEITVFYDPMISKLISYGKDRVSAIDSMLSALDYYQVHGISHNLTFLSSILSSSRFISGNLSTSFIEEEYPRGFFASPNKNALEVIIPTAAFVQLKLKKRRARMCKPVTLCNYMVLANREYYPISISEIDNGIEATYEERTFIIKSNWRPGNEVFCGEIDNIPVVVQLAVRGTDIWMSWRGTSTTVTVRSERAAEFALNMPIKESADLSNFLISPMPGLVVSISIQVGDQVRAGQPLVIVDAMKMENVLRAERDAIVSKIMVSEGDSVAVDQVIIEFN